MKLLSAQFKWYSYEDVYMIRCMTFLTCRTVSVVTWIEIKINKLLVLVSHLWEALKQNPIHLIALINTAVPKNSRCDELRKSSQANICDVVLFSKVARCIHKTH